MTTVGISRRDISRISFVFAARSLPFAEFPGTAAFEGPDVAAVATVGCVVVASAVAVAVEGRACGTAVLEGPAVAAAVATVGCVWEALAAGCATEGPAGVLLLCPEEEVALLPADLVRDPVRFFAAMIS